jgi:hypothetical protein
VVSFGLVRIDRETGVRTRSGASRSVATNTGRLAPFC